jgi:outer membrane lipoprotein-sorting protein
MHIVSLIFALLATTNGSGLSQQSSVDEILDALDARGEGLKSFTADLKLSEADTATGDATTRSGKIWYQAGDQARIHVVFDTKEANGKVSDDKIEYLLAGRDLIDRTYRAKTQVTRHVLKPGEKMNLLKLGEGPFPLPIGQKKEEVHAMFEVKKIDPARDDPPQTVHLELTPKPDSRFDKRFKTIDVWVGLSDQMPQRIDTLDKNESTTRTTELKNVKVNGELPDEDFTLPKIDAGNWQMIDEAFSD